MVKHERSTPLTSLRGVGGKISERLEALGIHSVEELPFLLPRAYQDRSRTTSISGLTPGSTATVKGQVMSLTERRYRRRRTLEMMVTDGTGLLVLKWFRFSKWLRTNLESNYPPGKELFATGRLDVFAGSLEMHHPEMQAAEGDEAQGIVPIYPSTEGLNQLVLRRIMSQAVPAVVPGMKEPIPEPVLARNDLPELGESLMNLHSPARGSDVDELNAAGSRYHRRLKFGELLLFQLGVQQRRNQLSSRTGIPLADSDGTVERFLDSLPFPLTGAQQRVLEEIRADLARTAPMHRLLQGDVGSGKTVIAFAVMVLCHQEGHQAALMAPTEVLAEQHFNTMRQWAEALGIRIALLTGRTAVGDRKKILEELERGDTHILVGTHALIQETVAFRSLALAVVDEQHRFGVMQRMALGVKGKAPHFLVITATPIPRSLSMVVYGDLDISTLDEMPPGRQPVETRIFGEKDRTRMHVALAKEVRSGRQAFIVYPLVEESDSSELLAAGEMAQFYREKVFPHLKIGLLTGRMTGEEKDAAMRSFRNGDYDILVATTVIEVGVDVPNATLMVIDHAERFGLSQLHQLRGRVGRGDHPSTCILMVGGGVTDEAKRRLTIMARSTSGFEIAEEDLRIRGPGDYLGVRQAGMPDFRYAHPMRDRDLMQKAHETARELCLHSEALPADLTREVEKFWHNNKGFTSSG